MSEPPRLEAEGFVLAGGRSRRMGEDKAWVELDGQPLVARAVETLRRACGGVRIVGSDARLARVAPVVEDLHPGCGPLSGMEAGLAAAQAEWSLFLAVDMPFVPAELLELWMEEWARMRDDGARIRMFSSGGRPQPGLCLLHREMRTYVAGAIERGMIERGELKVMEAFRRADEDLRRRRGRAGLWMRPAGLPGRVPGGLPGGEDGPVGWFVNLNTREDLEAARASAGRGLDSAR